MSCVWLKQVRLRATAVIAAAMILGVLAPGASALIVRTSSGRVVSVMPQAGVKPSSIPDVVRRTGVSPFTSNNGNLVYQNGPVLHTSAPYLVFWDPNGEIPTTTRTLLERYFTDVANAGTAGTDTYRVLRQYTDSTGAAGTGVTFSAASQGISDVNPYPTRDPVNCELPVAPVSTCVTDTQLQTEIRRLITGGLPAGDGANAPVYFMITPVDVNVCAGAGQCATDTFCAYHDSFQDGASQVLYAAMPELPVAQPKPDCQQDNPSQFPEFQAPNGDVGDSMADVMAHEYAETITDPLVGSNELSWEDPFDGEEVADNCETYGASQDPGNGYNPNAYQPVLGGSPTGGPTLTGIGPTGTTYDQLINGNPYYTQTLWSNGDVGCKAQPAAATIVPAFRVTPTGSPATKVSLDPSLSAPASGFSSSTWDFGDGTASVFTRGSAPVEGHTYSQPGSYPVTLTLVDGHGNIATTTQQVVVGAHPTASFTASPATAFVGSPVQFSGAGSADPNSGGFLTSYSWHWGDGTADGAGAAATHTFTAPGQDTVTLTVTNGDGLTSTTTRQVTVIPRAAFTTSATRVPTSAPLVFRPAPAGTSGASYRWVFGDGATGTGPTATHRYAHGGRYTVQLIENIPGGVQSTATMTVTITGRITNVTLSKPATLHVIVSGPGTLNVGGRRFAVRRFGTIAVKLPLSAAQKHRLRTGQAVTLTVKMTFVPAGGAATHVSKRLTLRG